MEEEFRASESAPFSRQVSASIRAGAAHTFTAAESPTPGAPRGNSPIILLDYVVRDLHDCTDFVFAVENYRIKVVLGSLVLRDEGRHANGVRSLYHPTLESNFRKRSSRSRSLLLLFSTLSGITGFSVFSQVLDVMMHVSRTNVQYDSTPSDVDNSHHKQRTLPW